MSLRVAAAVAVGIVLATPLPASEPGQPLDCSDWVFPEPGITCQMIPCLGKNCEFGTNNRVIDNEGRMIAVVRDVWLGNVFCNGPELGVRLDRTRLVAYDGDGETTLAYVDDRQTAPGSCVADRLIPCCEPVGGDPPTAPIYYDGYILFHEENGAVVTSLITQGSSGDGLVALRFGGFATTFDLLQTYIPAGAQLSFRVPYMPEGFQYADYFDTYYGDLATVGDWSQARPLQCGYPATPPGVGDYLEVVDTMPDPAPSSGRYYVTAVTHQGQRRYGRQSNGGVLSGRNPALLPTCVE